MCKQGGKKTRKIVHEHARLFGTREYYVDLINASLLGEIYYSIKWHISQHITSAFEKQTRKEERMSTDIKFVCFCHDSLA